MADDVNIPILLPAKQAVDALISIEKRAIKAGRATRKLSTDLGFVGRQAAQVKPAGLTQVSGAATSGASALTALSTGFMAVGQAAGAVFSIMKTGITTVFQLNAGILRLVAGAAKASAEFARQAFMDWTQWSNAMTAVGVIGGQTGQTLKNLEKFTLALGARTQFTATEVAKATLGYAKFGVKSEQVLKDMTEAAVNLAQATGDDLQTSMVSINATSKQFGITGKKLLKVVDQLGLAVTSSSFDMQTLVVAMGQAGVAAGAVDGKFEEVLAGTAVLKDKFVDASMAGTGMKNVLLDLNKPVGELARLLKKAKINTEDVKVSKVGLVPAMKALIAGFQKEGIALSELVNVGKRTGPALAALASDIASGASQVEHLAAKFEKADGVAAKMSEGMMNNTAGALVLLQSSWENLKLTMVEWFNEAIGPVLFGLKEIVGNLQNTAEAATGFMKIRIVDFFRGLKEEIIGTQTTMEFLTSKGFVEGGAKILRGLAAIGEGMVMVLQLGLAMSRGLIGALRPVIGLLGEMVNGMGAVFEIMKLMPRAMRLAWSDETLEKGAKLTTQVANGMKAFSREAGKIADSAAFDVANKGLEKLKGTLTEFQQGTTAESVVTKAQFAATRDPRIEAQQLRRTALEGDQPIRTIDIELALKGLDQFSEKTQEKIKDALESHVAHQLQIFGSTFGGFDPNALTGTGNAQGGGD